MTPLTDRLVVGSIDGIRVPTDNILLPLCLETIFVGAFTCLIIISTYLLACRGVRDRPRLFMLIATLLMYAFSTTHWILYMDQALCALKHTCVPFRVHAQQVAVQVVIPINFLLSDAIIIWRTWLIWERRSFVLIIAAPLLLATAVTSIANVVLLPNDAFLLPTIIQSFAGSWTGFAALALTLVTNLWTTMLVAYRAWQHRRDVRDVLRQSGRRSAVEKVLALLVESGCIYCAVWILHMIADAGVLGLFGVIVSTCTVQITGLYPTIIVVFVCLQRTSVDTTFSAMYAVLVAQPRQYPASGPARSK
ncbi:hypothetical protein OF83DRAFT_371039 [Amylostereum chailletii]|nr:hypothetical protein OF83DRAFT_371039 [Amylostereum chailletii]